MLDEQSGESASPMSRERTPDGPAQATRSLGRTGGVQVGHGDSGGASRYFLNVKPDDESSRFFYTGKASRSDREDGMPTGGRNDELDPSHKLRGVKRQAANNHPTVKPTDLMRWLCKLITPPNGLILDPFCGSGSTGVAAVAEGFRFIGIEQDADYVEISKRRIANVAPLFNTEEE
jgi:site-specific DNA-methyltransferase (adenine-specific)